MADRPFHPLANEYPLMKAEHLVELAAAIKSNGQREKITILNGQVLDGRNRWIACNEILGIPANETPYLGPTDEPTLRQFVTDANERRMHHLEEFLAERRRKRAFARREAGESFRSIAENEGVSLAQVQRDLGKEERACTGGDTRAKETPKGEEETPETTPEAESETELHARIREYLEANPDASGREAAAALDCSWHTVKAVKEKLASKLWCSRCQRIGTQAVDCSACKTIREDAEKKKKAAKKKHKAAQPGEMKDRVGTVLPDTCRDAFADTSLPTLIEELEQLASLFRCDPWLDRAQKLTPHFAFLLITKFKEHAYNALESLQLAIEALKAGTPYAVCPRCEGARANGVVCRGCRGNGFVPETRYAELSK